MTKISKKGQEGGFGIFRFMIVSFLAVVFFAGLIYATGLINDVMHQAGESNEANAGQPGYTNMTLASDNIFGQMNTSIQALRMVAIVYILCLGAVAIIIGMFERKHPALFFVYVLLAGLAVYFSPQISNAYETLLNSNIFAGELNNFTASNFILLNLPIVVLVISFLGLVGLFINLIRSGGNETNLMS